MGAAELSSTLALAQSEVDAAYALHDVPIPGCSAAERMQRMQVARDAALSKVEKCAGALEAAFWLLIPCGTLVQIRSSGVYRWPCSSGLALHRRVLAAALQRPTCFEPSSASTSLAWIGYYLDRAWKGQCSV